MPSNKGEGGSTYQRNQRGEELVDAISRVSG